MNKQNNINRITILFSLLLLNFLGMATLFSLFSTLQEFEADEAIILAKQKKVKQDLLLEYERQVNFNKTATSGQQDFFWYIDWIKKNPGTSLFIASIILSALFITHNCPVYIDDSGNIIKFIVEGDKITNLLIKSTKDTWTQVDLNKFVDTTINNTVVKGEKSRTWLEYLYSFFYSPELPPKS